MKSKLFLSFFIIIFLSSIAHSQSSDTLNSDLYNWLKSLPDVEVTQVTADKIYTEAYEIFITQPVDQNNPDGPKFRQQLFLSHIDKERPMVIELDGYAVDNRTTELSKIIGCNQIMVNLFHFLLIGNILLLNKLQKIIIE